MCSAGAGSGVSGIQWKQLGGTEKTAHHERMQGRPPNAIVNGSKGEMNARWIILIGISGEMTFRRDGCQRNPRGEMINFPFTTDRRCAIQNSMAIYHYHRSAQTQSGTPSGLPTRLPSGTPSGLLSGLPSGKPEITRSFRWNPFRWE